MLTVLGVIVMVAVVVAVSMGTVAACFEHDEACSPGSAQPPRVPRTRRHDGGRVDGRRLDVTA